MALNVGTRLAHYDVAALIGEGRRRQVWQATDTQLNRQLALKILPDAFADDPDRPARSQREAQVLTSLNHPGIAHIHGIEEAQDTRALVLEFVEGPTLADRIAQGAIPIDEALRIAKQLAEALDAVHEQGVIHRDLKPANVKVRDNGRAKVLAFGLAKALDPAPEGDPSQFPTLTAAATQMGVIPGDGSVHVARAGAGEGSRQTYGHLGVWYRVGSHGGRPRGFLCEVHTQDLFQEETMTRLRRGCPPPRPPTPSVAPASGTPRTRVSRKPVFVGPPAAARYASRNTVPPTPFVVVGARTLRPVKTFLSKVTTYRHTRYSSLAARRMGAKRPSSHKISYCRGPLGE